ncbi:MAG: GNAT family N-acetyltransferase, partial [Bacteroidota bacterium]|nr:GNAT family N-acetyltransferase [Bacteroidota bacterium]
RARGRRARGRRARGRRARGRRARKGEGGDAVRLFAAHTLRFYRRSCVPVVLLTGDVDYRIVDGDAFPWEVHPLKEFNAQYRARFSAGARALIASRHGTIVFSAWIATRDLRIDELHFSWTLPAGDAAVYDCVTMPEHRGHGIYTGALRRLSGLLAEEGFRHLWIYAEEDNAASLRGIEKADFEFRGSISLRSILGVRRRAGSVAGVNAS